MTLTTAVSHGRELMVIGSDDGLPVVGATLLSGSGHIVGSTDNRGMVNLPDAGGYPHSLRSMGYEVMTIAEPVDTVVLKVVEYTLPELSVVAAERPIRRILWYAREYSTGATGRDTMQLYSEYMLESFVVDRKVKGYHSSDAKLKTKSTRRYARIAGAEHADSIFMPREGEEITLLAWGSEFCKLPEGKTPETAAIRGGAAVDSIAGKYSTEKLLLKSGNRFTEVTDRLSDHKNHSWSPTIFKLLGMTIDINRYSTTLCFMPNDRAEYDIYDLLYSSVSLDFTARGKIFKWLFRSNEPLRMNTSIELYPVDITTHSIDEYKELRKDKTALDFQFPETVLPEIPAAGTLKQHFPDRKK